MASKYMGCLKRKDFDDAVVDYFHGDVDVLAPPKKLRLELVAFVILMWNRVCFWYSRSLVYKNKDPGLPSILEDPQDFGMPCDEMPVEITQLPQPPELPVMVTEPPPVVPIEEKALVLYKPVNPPMFPGGPAAGSSDLPFKFNANCFPNPRAWQFHGNGSMPELFRLSRSSHSMSSPGMLNTADIKPVDNSLAMIPWVPSQFPTSTQEACSDQKPGCDSESNDLRPVEDEDMVSMEEDPAQHLFPTNVTGIDGVQWQHCMTTPQPSQNAQVMWSY